MDSNEKHPPAEVTGTEAASDLPDELHQPRGSFALKTVGAKKTSRTTLYIVLGAFVLLAAILSILWYFVLQAMADGSNEVDESQVKADPGLAAKQSTDDAMAQYKAAVAKREAEDAARKAREDKKRESDPGNAKPSSQSSGTQTASQKPADKQAAVEETPATRKLGGGVIAPVTAEPGSNLGASGSGGSRNGGRSSTGSQTNSSESALLGDTGTSNNRSRGALSALGASPIAVSKAYLAPDGKYLLRNNTYSRCALYTEVITEHESKLTCYLVSPLYSSDGSTLLADAGARMTGEQKIEMKPGQAQIFSQWNDLEVESGQPGVPNVRVRFDALGTGPMGSSGTKGWIDNKYIDRYGGAIVLSGFKDLLQAAVNTTQRGGDSGYTINNSEQNVEDIASKTLDANININPVGYLLPGTVINVTIARDIDFSTVYENR